MQLEKNKEGDKDFSVSKLESSVSKFLKTKQSEVFNNFNDTTIIIPTLNEEKNISQVIKNCKKYSENIIVVDDSSTDKTQSLAKKAGAKVINRTGKQKGLTASVLEGIKTVKTKYFIVIDGDGQHDSTKIPEITKKLKNNQIVVGVRSAVPGWPWHRRLMSWIAELIGKIRLAFTGTKSEDLLSGFFGAKTEYVKKYVEQHEKVFVKEGYKVLFDILKHSRNIKIGEIEYVFQERMGGKSKIGKKQILGFLKSLVK